MTPEQIAKRQDEIAQELYAIHQRQSALWTEQEKLLDLADKPSFTIRQIILGHAEPFTIAGIVDSYPQFARKSIETKIFTLERAKLIRRVGHGQYEVAKP